MAKRQDNAQTIDLSRLARSQGASKRIERGDVIEVSIAASLNEKDKVVVPTRVNAEGIANLPLIGALPVAGLELEAAEAAVVSSCIEKGLYRSPHVTVTMKAQRMNRVTVMGAVANPGTYELPRSQSDLLAALAAAGSLSKEAGTNVEIRNPVISDVDEPLPIAGQPEGINPVGLDVSPSGGSRQSTSMKTVHVDLVSEAKAGSQGYYIDDGGVVNVEKRVPEPIHVIGLVKKPNRYEYPIAEEMHMLDAIALAGGASMNVASKVYVVRREPETNQLVVIKTTLGKAKRDSSANLVLAPGDIVSVEATPATVFMETLSFLRFGVGASLPLQTLF